MSPAEKPPRRSARLLRHTAVILGLGLLLSVRAHAGCDPRNFGTNHVKFPQALLAGAQSSRSIVGLWHAVYTATDGTDFNYQSFDVWHADGTEFESADLPPVVGALCVGVWEQHGSSVHLNHFGWTWDTSGTVPTGSFNLILTLNVQPNGTVYQGTFDFRPYDVNGVFQSGAEHKGNVTASRITLGTQGGD
ncbi:MAG TPA: hypothetical protein VMF64_03910 [Steroidobacteraceae bacterium]|nr:hypothetical protein [Steroidobacteraceae bacterium]